LIASSPVVADVENRKSQVANFGRKGGYSVLVEEKGVYLKR
jgi:hypothetical protein